MVFHWMCLYLTCFFFVKSSLSVFSDHLDAQQLLGSHFGRPGLPGAFDYVIVGGGTAGLAVARRLAANASVTVAVIEAGDFYETDNGNLSTVPAYTANFVGKNPAAKNPLIDWEQRTEPQAGLNGESVLYTAGKTLGGGSARNFFIYQRGTIGSYQKWANQVADASYSWDNFLPYFQKSVQLNPPNTQVRPANVTVQYDEQMFATSKGPLKISYPNWVNSVSGYLGAALKQIGISQIPGLLSGNLLGWQYSSISIDPIDQTRTSSESSYLREALVQTTNLVVYKSTLAKRILFENMTAIGVEVDSGGVVYQIQANKEVIVSAGAFRSPQLLMVSGIGPESELEKFNISVLAKRPGVGQNMWVIFGPSYVVDLLTHSQLSNATFFAESIDLYNSMRTGILTSGTTDILGFEKIPSSYLTQSTREDLDTTFGPDWPDIELVVFDGYLGYSEDLSAGGPLDGKNYVSAAATLAAPFSRGNVTISSMDTRTNPVINPSWLTDPRDEAVAVAAFKRCRDIMNTTSMKAIRIGETEALPGYNVSSDTQILEFVRRTASTVYHASGTNAMGKIDDEMAVVDSKARVIGVERLRVVDASIFPVLPPGHPQATVYALAELIADAILNP